MPGLAQSAKPATSKTTTSVIATSGDLGLNIAAQTSNSTLNLRSEMHSIVTHQFTIYSTSMEQW
jgi:hypothetical protein